MSTNSHTPGPWTIHDQVDSEGFTIIKGQGLRLAKVTNSEPDWAEANAHLIAAAPELLEALEAAAVSLSSVGLWEESQHARAAIAKAEGRV